MAESELRDILVAALECLKSAKIVAGVRISVRRHAPEYEECVDVSLSQQLEMVSGLMNEYAGLCDEGSLANTEAGEEPTSYSEAMELVGAFLDIARSAIEKALSDATPLAMAFEIGVRAQTFAAIFGRRAD
jgi:hypothetical protein